MSDPAFDAATAPLALGVTRIEASAGTGKTYTLTALFLRLIAEAGLEINSILVTTFTIPATAELRDRIRSRLRGAVAMFDDGPGDDPLLTELHPRWLPRAAEIRPRLERALRHFDEAAIATIHGFCQRLLQERAFESGVTFDAELLTDQSALIREVAEDFWRTRIYPASPRLGACAMLEKLDAAALAKMLETAIARPTMTILPPWEAGMAAAAEEHLGAAFSDLERVWAEAAAEVREIFDRAASWAKGAMKKPDVVAAKFAALERCLADASTPCCDYEAFQFFSQESVAEQTARPARNPPPPPEHPFFAACGRLAAARARWLLALRREFLHDAPAVLAERKGTRNVLSFDDLLTRLHAALQGGRSAALIAAVRQRFSAALVDEFQDTDPVQSEIFRGLFAGHGRLWFIGDPKQAIYGFRGADVFSYLAAVEHADHEGRLAANQRSTTPLVGAVNEIFGRASRPFVIDRIDFHPANATGRRDPDALDDGPPFKFWLWTETKEVTGKAAARRLPPVVADGIAEQLLSGTRSGGRTLAPADFAVLTADNRQARAVHAALTAAGLPAVVLSNAGIFQSPDAADFLALLTALAQPAREDLLRAALATTALGFDAAALAALGDDTSAWEQVLERFAQHHADWLLDGFFAAFRRFLVAWAVRPRLLALRDGERRLTNLLHLAELLHHAATAQRLGPAALAQWLGTQMHPETRTSEEHEQRLENDEAAVKVVTIHKSKGLEFNVVWVPFSWGAAGLRDGETVTFHAGDGGALQLDLGTPDIDAHRSVAERERLAEHVRLLYVALTRSRLACHFVWGNFKSAAKSAAAWVLHPPTAGEARPVDGPMIRADIATLAASAPASFAVADLPEPRLLRWTGPAALHPPRAARHFTASIPRDWTISSFTSLTAAESSDVPDYDRAAPTPVATSAVALAGIHAFSRGRRAGTCLHEIFERLDFRDDAAIDSLVASKLGVFGFDNPDARLAVSACVRRTLAVELAPGLRLANVPMVARLNEVEFHLPVAHLTPARVRGLLGESLSFAAFSGFLKGVIDLVFEHAGRFYIVDWKSNWLGADTSAYHPEAVQADMARHHYGLQYSLYTVALHRHLGQRIPDYDYARHFGGVFYLFLRGVDLADPESGIHRARPTSEMIREWDALFSPADQP